MSAFENDPTGWTEEWDETYQCYFFFHAASGESSWERPVGMPESDDAKELNSSSVNVEKKEEETVDIPTEITDDVISEAANWTVGWDDNYEAEFFFNNVTGETSWEKPACLVALQSQDTIVESNEETEAARANPANWSVEWDSSYGCDFYFNTVTEESSWEKPACLENKDIVAEQKEDVEQTKTETESETETENVTEKKIEEVTETISTVEVTVQKPTRKNSVMRRPSVRPELSAIKKTSLLGQISTLPPPPPTSDSASSSSTSAPSKRRQSLAPRPSTLPPKPVFVHENVRTKLSSIFNNDTEDQDDLLSSSVIIEGDEEEEDEDGNDENEDESSDAKKLMGTDVMNDLTAYLESTGKSSTDLASNTNKESEMKKPRAIGTYFMKKSPAMMKAWQKRYVVLKDGMLRYYSNKGDYDAEKDFKGEIDIRQVSAENVDKAAYVVGSKEIRIHVQGDPSSDKASKASKDRVLIIQAVDAESAVAWLEIFKDWVEYVNA